MKEKQIYDYVERLSNLLRNDMRREGAAYGLLPVQLEALHYLSICNRYSDTPMGVTEYLGQTKGTVSQSLKILEKKGLIAKHADSRDKRVTHLRVSHSGKKLLAKSIPAPKFAHTCRQLNAQSQTRIVEALKELLLALQRSNGMKVFGVCRTCRHNNRNEDGSYFCGLTKEPLSDRDVELICREHEE